MTISHIAYSSIAGFFLTAILFSCQTEEATSTEALADSTSVNEIELSDAQYKAVGVELGSVLMESVSSEVKANGRVDLPPENRATVSLPIGGKIKYVKALPGQRVRKGELVATLESFEFIQLQQDYLHNASQLGFLEKELERQRTLSAENVGARKNFEQAQANFTSTKALVQSLEAKLRMLGLSTESLEKNGISTAARVTSPVNGYITIANINLGKEVAAGDVLLEVIDKSHMHIELTVFEQDAPFIKEGQSVKIIQNNGTPIEASVYLVGRMLEGDSRTMNVHAHIRNEKQEGALLPGAYVSAYIRTGDRTTTTVPADALVRKGASGFVYVQEGDRVFKRIPVEIGGTSDVGNTEIITSVPLNGLKLVVKGAYLIDSELAKRSEPAEE